MTAESIAYRQTDLIGSGRHIGYCRRGKGTAADATARKTPIVIRGPACGGFLKLNALSDTYRRLVRCEIRFRCTGNLNIIQIQVVAIIIDTFKFNPNGIVGKKSI